MSLRNPKSGPGNVMDYQISALPWVTSSTMTGVKSHHFPKITSFLLVKNTSDNEFKFAFTLNGLDSGNYITLEAAESLSTEVRVKRLFLSGTVDDQSYTVFAGLTVIDESHMPFLTSSQDVTGSVQNQERYWEGVG